MQNWIIVSTFFCLWISTMFNGDVQAYLAYISILTFGVLHGANDLNVIRRSFSKSSFSLGFAKVLIYYIFTVLFILRVFFVIPSLALFLFILLSGYHFGEQHFKTYIKNESVVVKGFYLFYGLFILFMLFEFNLNKVLIVFNDITGVVFPPDFFYYSLIISCFGFMALLLFIKNKKGADFNVGRELFNLLVLSIVFKTADLLWGFSIYFIIWHSLPSLKDQLEYLYGKQNKEALLKYIKSSFVYWLASIVGLFCIYFIFQDNKENLVSILVYFLAAITFPHVIVMSKLENN